jgi:hypothetical protein
MSRSRILVASHYNATRCVYHTHCYETVWGFRRRLISATNSRTDLSNDVREHAQLACAPITP